MSRLTVVIPALGSTSALENSLVSVLEHRPMGCDVIVVLRETYADPYNLAGEVRFIDASRRADAAECIRLGMAAAESDFVFVLAAGLEVTAGWSDTALKLFANPRIAAVVPRLALATDPTQTVCHGVRLLPGGNRLIHTGPAPLGEELLAGAWAPAISAGFYRQAAIDAVDGFSPATGGPLADARLAAALHRSRWLVAWAPTSVVHGDAVAIESGDSRVSLAWSSQRLAWETTDMFGGTGLLRGTASVMLAEFLRTLPSPMAFVLVAVRLAASLSGVGRTKHAAQPPRAIAPVAGSPSVAQPNCDTTGCDTTRELEPGIRRVDRSHGFDRREPAAQPVKRV